MNDDIENGHKPRPAIPNGQLKRPHYEKREDEKQDGENGPGTRFIVVDDRTDQETLYAAYADLYSQFRELERRYDELATIVGRNSPVSMYDHPEKTAEIIAYAKGLQAGRNKNERPDWLKNQELQREYANGYLRGRSDALNEKD